MVDRLVVLFFGGLGRRVRGLWQTDIGQGQATDAPELAADLSGLAERAGFTPTRQVVELHGRCAACSETGGEAEAGAETAGEDANAVGGVSDAASIPAPTHDAVATRASRRDRSEDRA